MLSRFAPLDQRTAALGTLPGAASAMPVLSESLGADSRLVALMQYGRVVLVVASAAVVARLVAPPAETTGLVGLEHQGVDPLIQNLWMVYIVAALVAVAGVGLGSGYRSPPAGCWDRSCWGSRCSKHGSSTLRYPPASHRSPTPS